MVMVSIFSGVCESFPTDVVTGTGSYRLVESQLSVKCIEILRSSPNGTSPSSLFGLYTIAEMNGPSRNRQQSHAFGYAHRDVAYCSYSCGIHETITAKHSLIYLCCNSPCGSIG